MWDRAKMSESWLEIGDTELDAREIQRRVEERMAGRDGGQVCPDMGADWARTGAGARDRDDLEGAVSRWLRDCDLVPARYQIDWRVPIIGPIHAAIRRVILAEIRRYLLPSLVKQSHLNRAVLRLLRQLDQENARLRQEVEELRQSLAELDRGQARDR